MSHLVVTFTIRRTTPLAAGAARAAAAVLAPRPARRARAAGAVRRRVAPAVARRAVALAGRCSPPPGWPADRRPRPAAARRGQTRGALGGLRHHARDRPLDLDARRGFREGRRAHQPPPGDQARHPGLHRAAPTDRIGIVLFSGRAYTLAPLTFDHDWLARQLSRVRIGMIEDGTAIGDGLGVALTRLEQAKRERAAGASGAFVVLMTDGANNRGVAQPRAGRRDRQVARRPGLHHRLRQGGPTCRCRSTTTRAARSPTGACSPISTRALRDRQT
jgi:hypothetical protein